jgi:hypothetical protein
VTVKQLGSGPSAVYYRVGSGNWQPLTLSGGQGTFTATGEYEVAARCDDNNDYNYGNTLNLFKASTGYRNQVTFFCGNTSGPRPSTRDVRFTITLPSSVGGVSLQGGDLFFLGSRAFTLGVGGGGTTSTSTVWGLKTRAGSVVNTLHRPSESPSGISSTPYGYKVVNLGASDTSVTVDGSGWQAFTSTRNLSASMPVGFQGSAFVFHFKDAYLTPAVIGVAIPSSGSSVTGKYGFLPSGGVYLGFYFATNTGGSGSPTDTLIMLQDTGGNDWDGSPPAPWTSGQFSVNGDTLTFARTDAKAFTVGLFGLAQRTGGIPLRLRISVQAASSGNTTYQIPVVPGLDYELINNPGTVYFFLQALVWDRGVELLDAPGFLTSSGLTDFFDFLTEAQVSGINVAVAMKSGSYSDSSYTLP